MAMAIELLLLWSDPSHTFDETDEYSLVFLSSSVSTRKCIKDHTSSAMIRNFLKIKNLSDFEVL